MFNKSKKEKKKGVVRRGVKSMFNIRRWLAFDDIMATGKDVTEFGKSLFVPQKAEHHETYEEALKRLNLTEKDVEERKKGFLRLAIIYLCMAVALLIYTLYVFLHGYMFTSFLCLTLTILILVYAYREHFWYMQIKHRKFGLKFREWLNYSLGRDKK